MEFKTRMSSTFIMNIFMIALALGMAVFSYFYKGFRYPIFNYSCILWLFIAYVRLMNYRRYIYLMLNGKPVLIVNENYIYDLAKDIKYYWQDIDEIFEENSYLYIKLHKPNEYLEKLEGGVKRFISDVFSNKYNTPFVINADMVNVNSQALLEMLDNYSMESLTNEN